MSTRAQNVRGVAQQRPRPAVEEGRAAQAEEEECRGEAGELQGNLRKAPARDTPGVEKEDTSWLAPIQLNRLAVSWLAPRRTFTRNRPL